MQAGPPSGLQGTAADRAPSHGPCLPLRVPSDSRGCVSKAGLPNFNQLPIQWGPHSTQTGWTRKQETLGPLITECGLCYRGAQAGTSWAPVKHTEGTTLPGHWAFLQVLVVGHRSPVRFHLVSEEGRCLGPQILDTPSFSIFQLLSAPVPDLPGTALP